MKHIFLNLKRFDITPERGGVNRLAEPARWGEAVASSIRGVAEKYADVAEFAAFLPEAHLVGACAGAEGSPLGVGCQGVHVADTAPGGNFGAFTTLRTGNSVAQLGCTWALIGHCEERMNLRAIMGETGADPVEVEAAVSRILSREVRAAQAAGLKVLFCMGEREEEVDDWEAVLTAQVTQGLEGARVGAHGVEQGARLAGEYGAGAVRHGGVAQDDHVYVVLVPLRGGVGDGLVVEVRRGLGPHPAYDAEPLHAASLAGSAARLGPATIPLGCKGPVNERPARGAAAARRSYGRLDAQEADEGGAMGERTANVQDGDIGRTLTGLAEVIRSRREASPESSYTARLLGGVEDELLKKLAEEASEVIMACKDDDHDHIRYEAADLVYHLMVALERYGVTVSELAGELDARHR